MAAGAAALGLPGSGQASSGGAGAQPPSTLSLSAVATPANTAVTASEDGITIAARASAFVRGEISVTGTVAVADAGASVQIQWRGPATGWAWLDARTAAVQPAGSFAVDWIAGRQGRFGIRAVLESPHVPAPASSWPTVKVTVYRTALATIYGPGLYGNHTACGQVLRRRTLGVANRTLPCGTPVSIYYGGRQLTVPVIDRGPYANHASWDLTEATARALGMTGTAQIGAAALPGVSSTSGQQSG